MIRLGLLPLFPAALVAAPPQDVDGRAMVIYQDALFDTNPGLRYDPAAFQVHIQELRLAWARGTAGAIGWGEFLERTAIAYALVAQDKEKMASGQTRRESLRKDRIRWAKAALQIRGLRGASIR